MKTLLNGGQFCFPSPVMHSVYIQGMGSLGFAATSSTAVYCVWYSQSAWRRNIHRHVMPCGSKLRKRLLQ